MSNLSNTDLVALLDLVSIQFNRYFSVFIFLFGIVGNLLNCLVLSRPSLRSNPCAFLFLISSIANIISITFGLTTRIMSGWDMDITTRYGVPCKIRAFVMFVSRSVAFWLMALAVVDRWLLSCSRQQRRQLSSLRNSQRGTSCIIILSVLLYCQILYCYEPNNNSAPLQCYGKTVTCRLVTDLTYALVTISCPLFIMCIFGLMTISNIRQTYFVRSSQIKRLDIHENKSIILKLTSRQRQRRKRTDRYLRHVLFIQIIFLTVLTIPQMVEKLYTTLTMYQMKTALHSTIDRCIYNFVLLLTYLASGMPFYIYTLSGGSIFRRTFLSFFEMK